MTGFRVMQINEKTKNGYRNIELTSSEDNYKDNYYTLLIGNNGTGKSRMLKEIAQYYKNINRKNLMLNSNRMSSRISSYEIYDTMRPSKIIAVSNSTFDKFPIDAGFRSNDVIYRELDYVYLGMKNRMNFISAKALMNRALDILFENYTDAKTTKNIQYVFEYLSYEPIIKIKYTVGNRKNYYQSNPLSGLSIKEMVEDRLASNNFLKSNPQNFHDRYEELYDATATFLMDEEYNDKSELIINFSKENSLRITNEEYEYNSILEKYRILGLLRKIGMIRSFEVCLYKKSGEEFDFSEASSGEATILSTVLGLIPLLKNNCLILIDEPETSLHPLWQAQYIDLLKKVMKGYEGCHLIIATHSHFLVTDLPVESSSIISFVDSKGFVNIERLGEKTSGWSAEDILLNIFKVPTDRNWYLSQLVTEVLELLSNGKLNDKRIIEIKKDLEIYYPILKNTDPMKHIIEVIFKEF